jgi:hypothetical protein
VSATMASVSDDTTGSFLNESRHVTDRSGLNLLCVYYQPRMIHLDKSGAHACPA